MTDNGRGHLLKVVCQLPDLFQGNAGVEPPLALHGHHGGLLGEVQLVLARKGGFFCNQRTFLNNIFCVQYC